MKQLHQILGKLDFSDAESKVYIALAQGSASAREVMKVTRQKRPTVYYALNSLEKKGLISRSSPGNKGEFVVESIDRLKSLIKEKYLEIERLSKDVESVTPFLNDKISKDKKPAVMFFEGVDAVKNVVMGSLYCRDKKILSIAPKDNFFWQFSRDFVEAYVSERVRNRIETRNLWEERIEESIYREYYEGVSDVRILPGVMHNKFKTTVFIYDNKTLYISSIKDSYAVLITSKEHNDMMRAVFDGLWIGSEKHS
ncbi:MAG TPA: helix-turn-helix domain-containing protein [Candidatus Paceibacterota bacterium]